jgi:L-iditol 2-dehydrogenase
MALAIGVDSILDAASDDVESIVKNRTGGLGVDCVLESIGYKSKTIPLALKLIRKGGQIVFTGVFEEDQVLDFGTLLAKEATIRASHAFGMWKLVPELSLALEMIMSGQFPAKELITHRFPLEKINEGFSAKLDQPEKAMKVEIIYD